VRGAPCGALTKVGFFCQKTTGGIMKTTNSRDPDLFENLYQDIIIMKSFIDGLIRIIGEFNTDLQRLLDSTTWDKQHKFQK